MGLADYLGNGTDSLSASLPERTINRRGFLRKALLYGTRVVLATSAPSFLRAYAEEKPIQAAMTAEDYQNALRNATTLEERVTAMNQFADADTDAFLADMMATKGRNVLKKEDVPFLLAYAGQEHVPHLRHLALKRAEQLDASATLTLVRKRAVDGLADTTDAGFFSTMYAIEAVGIVGRTPEALGRTPRLREKEQRTIIDELYGIAENKATDEFLAIQAIESLNYLGIEKTASDNYLQRFLHLAETTTNDHIRKHALFALKDRVPSLLDYVGDRSSLRSFILDGGSAGRSIIDDVEKEPKHTNQQEFAREPLFPKVITDLTLTHYQAWKPRAVSIVGSASAVRFVQETLDSIKKTHPRYWHFINYVTERIIISPTETTTAWTSESTIRIHEGGFVTSDEPLRRDNLIHEARHLYNGLLGIGSQGHREEEQPIIIGEFLLTKDPPLKSGLTKSVDRYLLRRHWLD